MKSQVFSIFALVLFVFIGSAQEKLNLKDEYYFKDASIRTSFKEENIEYKFKSLDDLNKQVPEIIKALDFEKFKNEKETCEITIELKIEIVLGVTTVFITEKVISNCEEKPSVAVIEMLKRIITATIGKEIVKSDG